MPPFTRFTFLQLNYHIPMCFRDLLRSNYTSSGLDVKADLTVNIIHLATKIPISTNEVSMFKSNIAEHFTGIEH